MKDLPELAAAARAIGRAATSVESPAPGAADQPSRNRPAAPPAPRPPVRIGLVLSGGGAKGAYHNGVLDYLASIGTTVSAIAGASIGALNGAVIAAAPSLAQGVAQLDILWEQVSRQSVQGLLPHDVRLGEALEEGTLEETTLEQLTRLLPRLGGPALSAALIERLVLEHIDPARLRTGIPMWVSAFPALEERRILLGWGWAVDVVRAQTGTRAVWLRLGELGADDCRQAILASAALPLLLPPRRIAGRLYRDGGLADNTPAGALADHAGCDMAIVVHLSRGALWDAHHFPGLGMLEVRPSRALAPTGPVGGLTGLVDFSPSRVRALRAQGRADAERTLEPFRELLTGLRNLRSAERFMLDSIRGLLDRGEPDQTWAVRGLSSKKKPHQLED
ncbi:patatin-like phospholipase family protein [Streptomyces olindensis]|uniref:patatin-like phospholipase family protein n=1 Tax=Streptomyces olindensis TaxID=358823 RepID=UPI00365B43A4